MLFISVPFYSSRLKFRRLRRSDSDMLFSYITAEITRFWIGWECPASREECLQWVETIMMEDGVYFLAFNRHNSSFVGAISLDLIHDTREYEINIWVQKDMHGQGYATEMLIRFLPWLQKHTDLPYVIYSYTQGNTASRRLLKKIPHIFARKKWERKNGKRVYTQNFLIPLE